MANKKISELPAAGATDGTELFEFVQGGINKKITLSSVASGVNHWRGAWNASSNTFPSSGGTGSGGDPAGGDEWYIEAGGGGAPNGFPLNEGALIKARIDSPGQTQANWIITNN